MLSSIVEVFRWSLQPTFPFSWLGLPISTLDVVATFRTCLVLRQVRELLHQAHCAKTGGKDVEPSSYVKRVATTLLVVYGGEAIANPMLGLPPSFMVNGVGPLLYAGVQAIVDYLPSVPAPSAEAELPLAVIDGITRAYLLCNLIPPTVTANSSSILASSPWTLLLTSLITANAGFFLVNLLSFLHPTPLTVTTPPELQPYGWTTTDVWCAPAGTALYAFLTHAQPFWAELRGLVYELVFGAATTYGAAGDVAQEKPTRLEAVDPETARAIVAVALATLFVTKTAKNFGLLPSPAAKAVKKAQSKTKTQ